MSDLYSLEIVSLHSESPGKTFKKHKLEGIDTVGVWKNEPFLIRFTNHSYQKISAKISVDGLDLLTGELATAEPTKDMWVVNPYGTLEIKAWKEDDHGGAQLVFTSANNSAALHIHGDLTNRGIIAAAVYTEGHVESIKVNEHHHWNYFPIYPAPYYPFWYQAFPITITPNSSWTYISTNTNIGGNGLTGTTLNTNTETTCSIGGEVTNTCFVQNLGNLPSVGAGEYTEQEISYTAGLIKPLLSEVIRVRYLWANKLKKQLSKSQPKSHPSGFPADKPKGINLKSTPRIKTNKSSKLEQTFSRF